MENVSDKELKIVFLVVEKKYELYQELFVDFLDFFFCGLYYIICFVIWVLVLLMVVVIFWGVGDVIYIIYVCFVELFFLFLIINDIFYIFGGFMVVLIVVEIFINICLYLGINIFFV